MRYASMQTALCAVIIALFLILTEYAGSRIEKVKETADLIDRAALLSEYDRVHIGPPGRARNLIVEAPAVDAVPVVRCRDCIGKSTWYNDAEYGCAICGMSGMYPTSEHDYCSYGERKVNATD